MYSRSKGRFKEPPAGARPSGRSEGAGEGPDLSEPEPARSNVLTWKETRHGKILGQRQRCLAVGDRRGRHDYLSCLDGPEHARRSPQENTMTTSLVRQLIASAINGASVMTVRSSRSRRLAWRSARRRYYCTLMVLFSSKFMFDIGRPMGAARVVVHLVRRDAPPAFTGFFRTTKSEACKPAGLHGHPFMQFLYTQGFRNSSPTARPTARCSRWSRARAKRASAKRRCAGRNAIISS